MIQLPSATFSQSIVGRVGFSVSPLPAFLFLSPLMFLLFSLLHAKKTKQIQVNKSIRGPADLTKDSQQHRGVCHRSYSK